MPRPPVVFGRAVPTPAGVDLTLVDPWFGDLVRGPNGRVARMCGHESTVPEEGGRAPDGGNVVAEYQDGTLVTWPMCDVTVAMLTVESIPLEIRIARAAAYRGPQPGASSVRPASGPPGSP